MEKYLYILQIVFSILLVITIILQQRGTGLGSTFGGGGESYYSKRGFEKILFISTITLAVLFVASVFAGLFVFKL